MKPSYLMIKDHLLQQINDGKLKVGEKLPSEIEMAKNLVYLAKPSEPL